MTPKSDDDDLPLPEPPRQAAGADDVERIFRDHNEALVRFVTARLGSRDEATEVVQEAYVRLLSLDHREAISYLRAFLYKTAANLAIDRLRNRVHRERAAPPEVLERAVFELTPERQVAGEERIRKLKQAIDELPEKCREAYVLYRIEGYSDEAIAERLNIKPRMVLRYVARALEYIRERLA